MKTLTHLSAGLVLLLLSSSCTSVKRFKSADYKGEDNTLVDMSLFGTSLDRPSLDPGGKSLWDLSAGAQTQLIQILDERFPENGPFAGALNQEYMASGAGPMVDFTRNNLRMVFTISKKKDYTILGEGGSRFSPADRIEFLKFSLEIPEEYNLAFTGWNRYTTEYGEIEIADVSFSRSIDLSGDISTDYVDAGIKSTSGRKEDQAIRSRYLKLNGNISRLKIAMETEGNREIDLAGNVVADVSLAFEAYPERVTFPVYTSFGEDLPLQLSGLRFADIRIPRLSDLPDSIMATLKMEYIYRHVESGWKSYQEWDDRVAYYSGKLSKEVSLFHKGEYLPPLYCLGTEGEGKEVLKIRSFSGVDYPLQFLDYSEASRFLEWLSALSSAPDRENIGIPIKAGNHTFIYEDKLLNPEMLFSLPELKVMPVY